MQTECRSGFIHEGKADDVTCPHCHQSMCRKCRKCKKKVSLQLYTYYFITLQWHEGISCEAFAKWMIENDPNAQELGLAAYLQANGVGMPFINSVAACTFINKFCLQNAVIVISSTTWREEGVCISSVSSALTNSAVGVVSQSGEARSVYSQHYVCQVYAIVLSWIIGVWQVGVLQTKRSPLPPS